MAFVENLRENTANDKKHGLRVIMFSVCPYSYYNESGTEYSLPTVIMYE